MRARHAAQGKGKTARMLKGLISDLTWLGTRRCGMMAEPGAAGRAAGAAGGTA